jgi:pyruvate dehydrogenase E1 component alpha subunit
MQNVTTHLHLDDHVEEAPIPTEELVEFLHRMRLIRAFEEKAEELYLLGKVHGTMHLSIGQEACAVGAVGALRADDYILSTHRGHGHSIAKGADVGRMMAEFLGKETGYCRGRGGSMHIAEVELGNLGANGIVAGGLPLACGVGLSIKLQKLDRVVVSFFGDGAVNEGSFHESLNLAAIWQLPVVFFCENNQYAMSMPVKNAFSIEHLSQRACAYNIPGITVDGNDVLEVYDAVRTAAERARAGEGPSLIEAITYRWKGHSKSDQQAYRTREEVKEWQARDPIARLQSYLQKHGWLDEKRAAELEAEAQATIEEAAAFAEASPYPEPDEVLEGVYA